MQNQNLQNRLGVFLTTVLVVSMFASGSQVSAQNAYAMLENGTLTFYYNDNQPSGAFEINTGSETPAWNASSADITKVVFNSSFANYKPNTCYRWFCGCVNLQSVDGIQNLKTQNAESMAYMFYQCGNLKSLNLSGFNTAKVKSMMAMFAKCEKLNTLDLSAFNTQNVDDMNSMFFRCRNLRRVILSNFNTKNVANMYSMFAYCRSLNEIDLKTFNTSKVTDMRRMFYDCSQLKTIYAGDLWSTVNVSQSDDMFYGCNNLFGGYNTIFSDAITDKEYAQIDSETQAGYLTQSGTSLVAHRLIVASPPIKTEYCLGEPLDITGCKISVFFNDNSSKTFDLRQDLVAEYNPSSVGEHNVIIRVYGGECSFKVNFYDQESPYYLWDSKTLTATLYYGHYRSGATCLSTLPDSIKNKVEKIDFEISFAKYAPESTVELFKGCQNLVEFTNLQYFNTTAVRDMSFMFDGCENLRSLDLSNFNNTKAAYAQGMFKECGKLKTIYYGDYWDTDKTADAVIYNPDCAQYFTYKKAQAFVFPPEPLNLVFNNQPQKLIPEVESNLGAVLYSLDGKNYSEDIPSATHAGDYTVYYKVEDNEKYVGTQPQTINVNISKGKSVITTVPTAIGFLVDMGKPQPLITPGSSNYGTILYRIGSDGDYSAAIPEATEPGKYLVYYKIEDSDDYEGVPEQYIETKIDAKTPVDIAPETIKPNVWCSNGTIFIESASLGVRFSVIDITGRIITSSTINSSRQEIPISKQGIFVVTIGKYCFKVVNN